MTQKEPIFVIGATKAGTTTLHALLNSHPAIRMSLIKETYYYCPDLWPVLSHIESLSPTQVNALLQKGESRHNGLIKDLKTYQTLMASEGLERYQGEACPFYLRSTRAAALIQASHPNAKLIAVIRDPIQRALSHYRMEKRDALIPDTFEEAIREELSDRESGTLSRHGLLESGLYGEGLHRFLNYFPKNQLLILDIDHLDQRPLLDQTLSLFLSVEAEGFTDETARLNDWGQARHQGLNRFLATSGLKALIRQVLPRGIIEAGKAHFYRPVSSDASESIPPSLETALQDFYRQDVRQLCGFLESPYPTWVDRYLKP
ncbi:MAG: sulfotransferase [Gammaproteobacteria bacterium]|nr:sulfotransferase [Gammaproteobacteria bacterium]NDE55398.1 sulfotransferase [Gammaproteobacteria bacterium]NDG86552.1 sulfotransferase [Gammaproteobacteria bacterium]